MPADMNDDRDLFSLELKAMLKEALARAIEGEYSHHQDNPCYVTRKAYPMFTEIDNIPLSYEQIPEVILNWAGLDKTRTRSLEDILVFDLETTGLGRGGIFAFMIGLGYFDQGQFFVEQVFLPDPDAEVNSFDRILELLKTKSLLVTFNGKTFDVPVLESRLLYHQIWLNIRQMEHLDLLHIARRLWKNKLPSCALETIEFYILGHIRDKELDIEGGDIPQTYFHYLMSGDPELIRRIFVHNHHDILHTAALLALICNSTIYPPQSGFDIRIDYHALARLYLSQKQPKIAKRILIDLIATGVVSADIACDLGLLYKQEKDLEAAIDAYEIASGLASRIGMLELCKLQENFRKDYTEALNTAKRLEQYLLARPMVDSKAIALLQKRQERLQQKLQKQQDKQNKQTT